MQDLLGLRDTRRIKAVAGLAGGLGHQGAACGILTGGAIALALAGTQSQEDQAALTARAGMLVNRYAQWFLQENGGLLCSDIARTNFEEDSQVRRYILTRSRTCIRAASRAAAAMTDVLNEPHRPAEDTYSRLNEAFFERDFHCAYSVVCEAAERLQLNQMLGPNLLIPLNGGIGFSRSTCSALVGGCLAIGLARGGDTSELGILASVNRIILTLRFGASAFSRIDLSPANDALMRCSKLVPWFQRRFGTHACGRIIGCEVAARPEEGAQYFKKSIERCKTLAAETAAKAVELASG